MRKIKVWITVFFIYELIVLTILQIHRTCVVVFNVNFCNANNFKYFLMGFMVPVLFLLFVWWLPDISRAICKNKCQCETQNNTYDPHKSILHNIIDSNEIKKLITTMSIMLMEKLVDRISDKEQNNKKKRK